MNNTIKLVESGGIVPSPFERMILESNAINEDWDNHSPEERRADYEEWKRTYKNEKPTVVDHIFHKTGKLVDDLDRQDIDTATDSKLYHYCLSCLSAFEYYRHRETLSSPPNNRSFIKLANDYLEKYKNIRRELVKRAVNGISQAAESYLERLPDDVEIGDETFNNMLNVAINGEDAPDLPSNFKTRPWKNHERTFR